MYFLSHRHCRHCRVASLWLSPVVEYSRKRFALLTGANLLHKRAGAGKTTCSFSCSPGICLYYVTRTWRTVLVLKLNADMWLWPGEVAAVFSHDDQQPITTWHHHSHSTWELEKFQCFSHHKVWCLRLWNHVVGTADSKSAFYWSRWWPRSDFYIRLNTWQYKTIWKQWVSE